MKFNKVVVTGGAGFIGSNYVHYAVKQHPEWEIVVLDKLTYAGNRENLESVKSKIQFIQGDIADPESVTTALTGADAVVNFAAESHVDRSLMDPRPFVRTNVEGTLLLLETARRNKISRFLHISTDEVYGDLAHTTKQSLEEDVMRPRSPYAATKAGAEHLVFSYAISYGLNAVITRGSNTYGPYQYPEKIIPLFISNAIADKTLPVYGDGSAVRDYMHVEDHVAGVDVVLHNGQSGHAYNLGADVEISGITVAREMLKIMDKPQSLIEYVTDRPGHDYRYSVNPKKAESLGWVRKWDFLDGGLAATVKWYKENQNWWTRLKQKKEFLEHEQKCYGKNH